MARAIAIVATPVLVALVLWGSIQVSDNPLHGLSVAGRKLPERRSAWREELELQAQNWGEIELQIAIEGVSGVRRIERAKLGAALRRAAIESAVIKAGRSGNPFVDLQAWYRARQGELDLRWLPTIEREQLARFVDELQERAEIQPIVGVTDGRGWSLPGRDGQALDHASAMVELSRALHSGSSKVTLPVKHVPAPPPVAIGSPDGALFAEQDPATTTPEPPAPALPREPSADDNCYSRPPQRPFCDGPRDVPVPFGPAAEVARSLGLGELSAVGELLRRGPPPQWSAAAGTRSQEPFEFPVPAGKVGRGYGFVRKGDLSDRIHPGVDIVAPAGAGIHAIASGIVAYSDNRVRGYGNLLIIVHANGSFTLNAHCRRILVFAGQRVERGQKVAEVGMTGLAMGPHLHFEYHDGPGAVDPLPHLSSLAMRAGSPGRFDAMLGMPGKSTR